MKLKLLLLILGCGLSMLLSAHTPDYGPVTLRHWTVAGAHKTFDGTFLLYKNNNVRTYAVKRLYFDNQSVTEEAKAALVTWKHVFQLEIAVSGFSLRKS